MLDIQKKLISYNKTSAPGRSISYIVIHDTGNRSRGANANAHFNYFNGGDRQSSADFFVDDNNILQITNYRNEYAWHCGDGGGAYGITNRNSVGIEICINEDGNYDRAVSNALDLVRYLMSDLSLGIDRVVRHYDASRKNCPQTMSSNNWAKWSEFKKRLGESSSSSTGEISNDYGLATVIPESGLNVREGAGTQYAILGTLTKGQEVRIGFVDGNWGNIYFGDHGGWVCMDYLNVYKVFKKADQPKSSVMYRVILDGKQIEALSYESKAEEAVKAAVDSGRAKSGKVQRNTDGVDLFIYPSVQPSIDYEKELCRILVNEKNLIALTGKSKCVNWAKENYEGHIKIQCVKDSVFIAEFDNVLKKPEPPVEPPKPPVEPEIPKVDDQEKDSLIKTLLKLVIDLLKKLLNK